ncbi:hypothetical protein G7Z17_g717 [Cylindrodendrum hubeiense]|uniref:F-box domain-containing protein n=1 Tax=Cylindrodendrum hubeiense TaxID=595255 RepID=A0A9P5LM26_9HYPO|nr:hypothetical protein G7Z17_g717 [Cylindrodendrum hubeiense]
MSNHLSEADLSKFCYPKSEIVDNTLDDASLETRCPLDNGQHSTGPHLSAGMLDLLPPELITPILVALDLPTLIAFRRVSRRAMAIVDSLHEHGMMVEHCPDILRAIFSTHANSFDSSTLYRTLSTTRCATCDRFGNYLYIITCKRVCYHCFTENLDYLPLVTSTVATLTGWSEKTVRQLPSMKSLAGGYSTARDMSPRTDLVDRSSVFTKLAGDSEQASDGGNRHPGLTRGHPRRFMAIITAPVLGASDGLVDWGVFCESCRTKDTLSLGFAFRTKFTMAEIVKHIEWHREENTLCS